MSKSFGDLCLFEDLSFSTEAGSILALVGASGSGKSTLLGILGGLDEPTSGNLFLDDEEVNSARLLDQVAWMPQGANSLPSRTVIDNAALGSIASGAQRSEAEKVGMRWLDAVGLRDAAFQTASTLSGGELARLALARVLAQGKAIVVADEPTGALDRMNTETLLEVFMAVAEANVAIVIATHDPAVAQMADVIVDLSVNGA